VHPFQKNCPTDDPKKFAAWCWAAGIPDPGANRYGNIPLIAPQLVEGLSEMLWDFGFRHHPDLQTKWIEGAAGIGTIAGIVDTEPVQDPIDAVAEAFLSEENPELLEAIKNAPPAEREKLLKDLERNARTIEAVLKKMKEE
jgi:hypothetical protein